MVSSVYFDKGDFAPLQQDALVLEADRSCVNEKHLFDKFDMTDCK